MLDCSYLPTCGEGDHDSGGGVCSGDTAKPRGVFLALVGRGTTIVVMGYAISPSLDQDLSSGVGLPRSREGMHNPYHQYFGSMFCLRVLRSRLVILGGRSLISYIRVVQSMDNSSVRSLVEGSLIRAIHGYRAGDHSALR